MLLYPGNSRRLFLSAWIKQECTRCIHTCKICCWRPLTHENNARKHEQFCKHVYACFIQMNVILQIWLCPFHKPVLIAREQTVHPYLRININHICSILHCFPVMAIGTHRSEVKKECKIFSYERKRGEFSHAATFKDRFLNDEQEAAIKQKNYQQLANEKRLCF